LPTPLIVLLNLTYLALSAVYPEHSFKPWNFSQVGPGHWDNIQNQREYFDWLAKELNIQDPSEWQNVSYQTVVAYKGGGVLANYGNSIFKALNAVYPEMNFKSWQFAKAPNSFWEDDANQREYLEYIGKQLNVNIMEDWYKITMSDYYKVGNMWFLRKMHQGSLMKGTTTADVIINCS
jgi:hypothetical protein